MHDAAENARRQPKPFAVGCAVVCLLLVGMKAAVQMPAAAEPMRNDPARIVGHEACAKCHANEIQQWQQTPHFATFDVLHRTEEAKQIINRLGLRSVKRNETCVQCHYTEQQTGSRVRVVAGVSCESCHGAATDWINIHADYGGANVSAASESPEHRQQRRSAAIAAGMNNPSNLYLVARQCFSCHTVPDENLVNVGGHRSGSHQFELVSWSQGKVRHNFVHGGGATNMPSPPGRLRVMYVVGTMTDLEFSLRATAQATQNSTYGQTCAARSAAKKQLLREIQDRVNDPHIGAALEAVSTVELRIGNAAAIVAAADGVSAAAQAFAEQADGNALAAIQDMLPQPAQYK